MVCKNYYYLILLIYNLIYCHNKTRNQGLYPIPNQLPILLNLLYTILYNYVTLLSISIYFHLFCVCYPHIVLIDIFVTLLLYCYMNWFRIFVLVDKPRETLHWSGNYIAPAAMQIHFITNYLLHTCPISLRNRGNIINFFSMQIKRKQIHIQHARKSSVKKK